MPIKKIKGNIIVRGMTGVATRMSKCCGPVPGDEIVGFITRGRGVTIHRTDCVNVMNLTEFERERLVETERIVLDDSETKDLYTAEIKIYTHNKSGMLLSISKVFTENKVDVTSMNVRTSKNGTATVDVSFDIRSKDQLQGLISKLRNLENIIDIERNRG